MNAQTATHDPRLANDRYDPRRTNDLVPHIVDYLARTQKDGLFAEYPISTVSYDEGYRPVTYGAFANAVNGLAHWIRDTLGAPKTENEALGYMGPNDLRYPALVLAAVKVGYIIFLTSPRNSVPAHIQLLERIGCKTMLAPSPRPPQIQAIADVHPIRIEDVPGVEELLEKQFEHFPYEKVYLEELEKPMFAVHTSGSTGFPKPLWYKHGTATTDTNLMTLEPPDGYNSVQRMFEGKRMFMTFPPFHAAYLVVSLFNCLPLGTVFISPISGAIPSAEGLIEGLKKSPSDIAFIVPSMVLELANDPEKLDYCVKNLEFIMYCGGDLPQPIGDIVASKIKLVNQYGASELGVCALLQSSTDYDPKDWKYVQFHPGSGHEFRHVVDDTYELYVVKEKKLLPQQPTFTIFPDIEEYPSRDLFTRHPKKPDMWSYKARADDVIVFLNGEKTNPISMEQHIVSSNPEVTAVVVIGAQRFQAALLIEIKMGKSLSLEERASFIEKLWPSIEEANRSCPAHAKIAKTHILFTSPGKPILRAAKGTTQRAGTLSQYQAEIDALYADADKLNAEADTDLAGTSVDLDDRDAVAKFIMQTMTSVTGWKSCNGSDNFFNLGMDSLQSLLALRVLRKSLKVPNLALSTMYTNASVDALTDAIIDLSKQRNLSEMDDARERLDQRDSTLKEFTSLIDEIPKPTTTTHPPSTGHVVILTGSTGALGSYILSRLLSEESVSHIYCLNRAPNSDQLQATRNATRSLPTPPADRTTFLTADLTSPTLGLPASTYSQLRSQTTLILHTAWPVNFNLPLPSFRPSLTSLLSLLHLASTSLHPPHLHYISSIGSVMAPAPGPTPAPIPARILPSPRTPLPNGYSESKHIAELLLAHASKSLGLSLSLSRVGQVAGAADAPGLWNPAEWFPSLMRSSAHVGAVPESLGGMERIDWVPVDRLAGVLVELAMKAAGEEPGSSTINSSTPNGQSTEGLPDGPEKPDGSGMANGSGNPGHVRVFHPVHPHPTSWPALQPTALDALHKASGKPLEVVPPNVWIDRVRRDMEADARAPLDAEELALRLEKNPAAKLLDFYESVMGSGRDEGDGGNEGAGVVLDVRDTARFSEKLAQLEPLREEWLRKWVGEWMDVGRGGAV